MRHQVAGAKLGRLEVKLVSCRQGVTAERGSPAEGKIYTSGLVATRRRMLSKAAADQSRPFGGADAKVRFG